MFQDDISKFFNSNPKRDRSSLREDDKKDIKKNKKQVCLVLSYGYHEAIRSFK